MSFQNVLQSRKICLDDTLSDVRDAVQRRRKDVAVLGGKLAQNGCEKGGLAGTVRPDQSDNFSVRSREIDVFI